MAFPIKIRLPYLPKYVHPNMPVCKIEINFIIIFNFWSYIILYFNIVQWAANHSNDINKKD